MPVRTRFPFIFLMVFVLATVGCVTSDRASREPRTPRISEPDGTSSQTTGTRYQRADTTAADAEAAGPRVWQERTKATREKTQRDQQPAARTAPATPQEFRDFTSGLAFTYAQPWYVVRTDWAGPILGRNGKSIITVRFATLTTDKKKASQPGFLYATADSVANAIVYGLSTLTKPISEFLGLGSGGGGKKKPPLPFDIALTQKHFPAYQIEERGRGNDGRTIFHLCRQGKNADAEFIVYHVIEGEKVASFLVHAAKDVHLRQEAQRIVGSTRLP